MKIALIRRSASCRWLWASDAGFTVSTVMSGLPGTIIAILWAKTSVRLSKQHRKLSRSAHCAFRPGGLTSRVQPEIRNALQPFLGCNGHLHTREVGADAAVNPQAERGMAILLEVAH